MKFLQLGPKLVFPSILVVNWVSSPLSFFLSASIATTYILTAPTSTTTIITLEPCALNAEFQHFILKFNKNFLTLRIPLKEGIGGWKQRGQGMKERMTLQITLLLKKSSNCSTVLPSYSVQLSEQVHPHSLFGGGLPTSAYCLQHRECYLLLVSPAPPINMINWSMQCKVRECLNVVTWANHYGLGTWQELHRLPDISDCSGELSFTGYGT
jgi:hypothetical protein